MSYLASRKLCKNYCKHLMLTLSVFGSELKKNVTEAVSFDLSVTIYDQC